MTRDARLAALLTGAFACLYVFTARGHIENVDAKARIAVTRALLERGSPALSDGGDLHFVTVPGKHAARVSHYGLGQSLIALPIIGGMRLLAGPDEAREDFAFALINPLCAALAVGVFALVLLRLGHSGKIALGSCVLLGAASPLWPASQSTMESPEVALLLLLIAWSILLRRENTGRGPLVLGALAMGWLLLTRETDALAALPLLIALVFSRPFAKVEERVPAKVPDQSIEDVKARPRSANSRTRDAGLIGVVLVPFVALYCGYNLWRYDSLLSSSGRIASVVQMGVPLFGDPLRALYGLLLSPGKGLLFYSPLVVAGVVGWPALRRRDPLLCIAAPLVFVITIATVIPLTPWAGDYAFGPRYLLGAAPLALLGVGDVLVNARRVNTGLVSRVMLAVAVVIAISIQVAGVGVSYCSYYLHNDLRHAFYATNSRPYFDPALSPILFHLRSLPSVVAHTIQDLDQVSSSPTPLYPPGAPLETSARYTDTAPFYWIHFDLLSQGKERAPLRASAALLLFGFIALLAVALRNAMNPSRPPATQKPSPGLTRRAGA